MIESFTYQNRCPHIDTTASLAMSKQILQSKLASFECCWPEFWSFISRFDDDELVVDIFNTQTFNLHWIVCEKEEHVNWILFLAVS